MTLAHRQQKRQTLSTRLPLRIISHASGIVKNRRADTSLLPVVAEELVRPRNTKKATTPKADTASALESMTLNMTVAQRVARRRRTPVVPFVPRKAKAPTRAVTRAMVRRRAAPVFSTASLLDPDEVALRAALQKPRTNLAKYSNRLPQTSLPTEGPAARINNDFDDESDEENPPVREGWSSGDLQDEKKRRLEVFNARPKGREALHLCDGCQEAIVGTRYECKHCDNFDLCRDCYTQPTVTYEHQHSAGETVVREL